MLTQIFSWSILLLGLVWAVYTLNVIKREKTQFKYHSKTFCLLHYRLFVPHWWSATIEETTKLRFERTDTRYDWYAIFTWKENPENLSLESLAQNWMNEQEIEIDPDRKETSENYCEALKENIEFFYRVEGTATEKESERIYYDLCFIKDKRFPQFFFAENKSSVLNGLVEGPYFEEVLKHLESMN